jgi:hypothetical protein
MRQAGQLVDEFRNSLVTRPALDSGWACRRYPPDSQIVFELWRRSGASRYTLRIRYRGQTLDQLRAASPLTLTHPPAEVLVTPTGCSSADGCPWSVFHKVVVKSLSFTFVKPDLTPSQIAPKTHVFETAVVPRILLVARDEARAKDRRSLESAPSVHRSPSKNSPLYRGIVQINAFQDQLEMRNCSVSTLDPMQEGEQ